jgi:hypothetical protein
MQQCKDACCSSKSELLNELPSVEKGTHENSKLLLKGGND